MTYRSTQCSAIERNLVLVRHRIKTACDKYHRHPGSVKLLAVSKTKPIEMIETALNCRQYHFGENYLQPALAKIEAIRQCKICWHFIGALQSNKTKPIAEHFDWVHTVANEKIARRLNDQRAAHKPHLKVLLQVNIDNETAKSGITPAGLKPLIASLITLTHINLRGLMAITRADSNLDARRQSFAQLRKLKESVQQHFDLPAFDQLSMGMSGDLEAAIAEGATMVRVGRAIFGARDGARDGARPTQGTKLDERYHHD